MKNISKIIVMLVITLTNTFAQNIKFNADKLYPEGTAYSAKKDVFFVSSVHTGIVGKLDRKGNYTKFIDDKEFISTIGLLVDDNRNLLYVNISDPGASIKSSVTTTGKLAKLAAYDLTTGKRKFIADLGILNQGGGNFANDLTLDENGNIYVTNSFSPMIFKVTQKGEASIFATSDLWKGEGFNLNGIVCHSDGYLLTTQMSNGYIYKVEIANPKNISKVDVEPLVGSDGLILQSKTDLVLISNSAQKVYKISSADNWKTAKVKNTIETVNSYPTTGVFAKGEIYVLNAKLDELFNPKATKTSDFTLQQITFEKKYAQFITYQLNDVSYAEYVRRMVEPDGPILANVKGLISKIWLADQIKNNYGGFYLWESKEAMEAFMQSDFVKTVVSRTFIKNVSSIDYPVNETPSKVTRGLK